MWGRSRLVIVGAKPVGIGGNLFHRPESIFLHNKLLLLLFFIAIHSVALRMPQNWHVPRGTVTLLLWSLLLITFPFMAWKALCVFTGSSHPIMVVISESMAPAFTRGDLIFLWNRQSWVRAGEIPVCWFPGRPLPMVHRAIKSVWLGDKEYVSLS